MATVQKFEDLEVWRDARELVKRVYHLTARFPKHETFGLTNQLRRAAVSVMSNIAEGFERGSNNEFVQFLFMARASCAEVRSQVYVALDLSYAPQAEVEALREHSEKLSRRLKTLIDYLRHSDMKGHKFHDEQSIYSVEQL
ncbi:MAG: four helix bundle protein [Chloroflexi bacterium]|nr:four helix bundle protein [Chloroflexota bacterium]